MLFFIYLFIYLFFLVETFSLLSEVQNVFYFYWDAIICRDIGLQRSPESRILNTLEGTTSVTYYWTVPLILDHSYLVGKLKSSKIADTKVSGF